MQQAKSPKDFRMPKVEILDKWEFAGLAPGD
jgi:hypothetical protein